MLFWSNYPLIRICLGFSFGILLGRFNPNQLFGSDSLYYSILAIWIVVVGCRLLSLRLPHFWQGNALLLTVTLLGFISFHNHSKSNTKAEQAALLLKSNAIIATVNTFPITKSKHFIYQIDAQYGCSDSSHSLLDSKILMYEKKGDSKSPTLNYGDKVMISSKTYPINPPSNPHEFDYADFMGQQNIFFQIFASTEQIKIISRHNKGALQSAVFRARQYFEKVITTHIKSPNEQGIVLALMLGIKGQLDRETKASYAAAGAMHILAVSGLHVGIIYLILSFLFRQVPSYYFRQYLAPILCISALWLYALLTGFSPSILRAVTMFSVIIFGKSLNRSSNSYNSLAFAALILLTYDPTNLYSVGFQLSFLAVIGIIYIYPILYKTWSVNSTIGDYLWSLTCVSIAAQIATFPISLYYFHQFPTYFLVSNLIVIPAAFVIMVLGIAILALSEIPIFHFIAIVLEIFTHWLNTFVSWNQKIPFHTVDWVYLTSTQVISIYAMIAAFFALIYYRKLKFAVIMTCCSLIIAIGQSKALISQSQASNLVFYSIKQQHIMDHISGLHTQLYSLDSIQHMESLAYSINPNRLQHHLAPIKRIENYRSKPHWLGKFSCMAVHDGIKCLYLIEPFSDIEIQFRLKTDILVISYESVKSLERITSYIDFDEIILDSTNGYYYTERILEEAKTLGIKIKSTRNHAYTISK